MSEAAPAWASYSERVRSLVANPNGDQTDPMFEVDQKTSQCIAHSHGNELFS